MNTGRALTAAALGLTVWASAPVVEAQTALVDSVPSISVEGVAKRDVTPDLAVANLGVDTTRPDAAQAADENAKTATAIVAAARQGGVANEDISTSEMHLAGIYDNRDPSRLKAFRATNHVTLKVHELGKLPALLGMVVAKGANAVEGITFEIADPRSVIDALRTEATQNAADKARLYAKAAGVTLGRVLRITPDNIAPVAMQRAYKFQMTDIPAPAPAPPVEPGTQTLESRVQITWELLP